MDHNAPRKRMFVVLAAAIASVEIVPYGSQWVTTAFKYVLDQQLYEAPAIPFRFGKATENYTRTNISLVNKKAEFIDIAYHTKNTGGTSIFLADVSDSDHWSYCDGYIEQGMRRHCYAGEAILKDLVRHNDSFYRSSFMSISFDIPEHIGPPGMLYTEAGAEIDFCSGIGWSKGDEVILSVIALPSLRVEVKNGKADVWVEANNVDTAGLVNCSSCQPCTRRTPTSDP